ncbi:MAG: outer membrane lipoprotein-sorting protein [Desulfobacterales bacterium]|nr:outer membrane lipoprotein-sorting protein [Desulfobacterales bacterium]
MMINRNQQRRIHRAGLIIGIFLAMAVLAFPGRSPAAALTGRQVMERVDARDDGDNMAADMTMLLIDKQGHARRREIKVFSRDQGKDQWRLQFFQSPADVKGTGFLSHDYYGGKPDDDQWLYLPALHKIKRIASSDKSSSFMGSDFSYADMTRRVLDEWHYKILKESEVGGQPVWLIEAVPVDRTVADRYGYEKSVLFVRQDIFMTVRAVNWVKKGGKLKYMEITQLERINGIWVATEIRMKTVKNKATLHRTVLTFTNVRFNQPLDDDLFTLRRLEKGL